MGIDSPVYRAIEKVVGLFDLQEDITIYSYKEEEHFKSLWSLIKNKETFTKLSTIIIAWDGIPSRKSTDLVNTGKYLTPVDWAVALSLAINDSVRDAKHPYPDLKILILDIGQSSTESDSIKFIDQFPKRDIKHLPWIRMFTPENDGDLWNLDVFFFSLIGVDNKDAGIPSMKEAYKKENRDLEVIKNIWASFLTRPSTPGDHHSLSNLVGPLLLIEDEGDLHVTALQIFMRAVSLLPEKTTSLLTRQNPWFDIQEYDFSTLETGHKDAKIIYEIAKYYTVGSKVILDLIEGTGGIRTHSSKISGEELQKVINTFSKKLTIIFIDDMVNSGWGKMLCWALGLEFESDDTSNTIGKSSDIMIKGFKSPQLLLEQLNGLYKKDKDQRFKFSINGDIYSPEILFLDLRLFSGKDIREEVKYFESLIPLAKKYNKADLPWQGFSKDEIGLVEAWIASDNKEREDDGYITALTFLPRILALTDLSLPIIVFSSTGRRDITEKLKPYGNIITLFEKPRFTIDISQDIVKHTEIKFQDAIRNALSILSGRIICQEAINLETVALTELAINPILSNKLKLPDFSHVEIYVDEKGIAGYEPFSIGGFIITYPDYSVVSELQKELIRNGIYWNTHHGETPLSKKLNDRKSSEIARKFSDICEKLSCYVAAVRLTEPLADYYENPNKRHFPVKDTAGDSIYIRTLSNLLELAVFELIPLWTNKETTLSIFPGTRTLPITIDNGLSSEETPTDYYGFGQTKSSTGSYYVISENSIASIVASLLNSRCDMSDYITIHHARGVVYAYGDWKLQWSGIRVQGYLTDVLLSRSLDFEDQFRNGFNEISDADLYILIDAQRKLIDGNTAAAIKGLYSCKNAKGKMHALLVKDIVSKLENIRGHVFMSICQEPLMGHMFTKGKETRPIIQYYQTRYDRFMESKTIEFQLYDASKAIVIVDISEARKIGRSYDDFNKNDYYYADISREQSRLFGTNLQKVSRD